MPKMIAIMKSMRTMMLTMHSTMSGTMTQMQELSVDANAMGQAFDAAKNDDSFFLPPEVFDNEDFKSAMGLFFSPDGKAMRLMISNRGEPGSPEAMSRVEAVRTAAEESLKTTPLMMRRSTSVGPPRHIRTCKRAPPTIS